MITDMSAAMEAYKYSQTCLIRSWRDHKKKIELSKNSNYESYAVSTELSRDP